MKNIPHPHFPSWLGFLLGTAVMGGVLCWAGDLAVDGNLNILGDLSVSGAVRGVVMPVDGLAQPDDAANRDFVLQTVENVQTNRQVFTFMTNTVFMGRVGIGTNAPRDRLHIAGGLQLDGPLRMTPQGDLSMGSFTNGPPL